MRRSSYQSVTVPLVSRAGPRQRGFTLIEVLIAVLVLAIGLLGLAGLQASSLRFNHDAQLRTQATFLAYDMADRIRANRRVGLLGAYDAGLMSVACDPGFQTPAVINPVTDLDAWRNALACTLPQGEGAIAREGPNNEIIAITVRWNERLDNDVDNLQSFTFRSRL